jgi:hypothetical protein
MKLKRYLLSITILFYYYKFWIASSRFALLAMTEKAAEITKRKYNNENS